MWIVHMVKLRHIFWNGWSKTLRKSISSNFPFYHFFLYYHLFLIVCLHGIHYVQINSSMGFLVNCNFMFTWSGLWETYTKCLQKCWLYRAQASWLNINCRSDSSRKASSELLSKIVGHGEDTGFQVPCLIVAANDDQDSFTMAIQEATMVFFIILFIWMIIYIIEYAYCCT